MTHLIESLFSSPIIFNHLSHIPTVTDIDDDIIVPLVSEFSIPQSHPTTTNDVHIPPTVSPTKHSEEYPLLKSLNIDTNLNSKTNKEQIVNSLSELVYLFKRSGKELNFIRGNDKPGILIPIPRAKNYTTFDKNERQQHWFESIISFIDSHNNTSRDDIIYWMLKHLYKKWPHVLVKLATDVGMVIVNKMSDIEAAAMWTEANISYHSARIILRHLHAKFNIRLQVPFSQIMLLSNITDQIKPTFGEFEYRKGNDISKIQEKIQYWTIDPIKFLEHDFARLLSTNIDNESSFGYESNVFEKGKKGVICVIGSDHGAGKSRYLLCVNYLPSSTRRQTKRNDTGTQMIQFAEVTCKKDVHEVQSTIAPVVNKSIDVLKNKN